MVTMKEALAKVDVAQLNDWESERYEEWKDKTWEVSPKQQSVINKMQKLANGSSNEPPKEDTSFEYGANKPEPQQTYTPEPIRTAIPNDSNRNIFVTGVVGRAMGSGNFQIQDIDSLTSMAIATYNKYFI